MPFLVKSLTLVTLASVLIVAGCRKKEAPAPMSPEPKAAGVSIDAQPAAPDAPPPPPVPTAPEPAEAEAADPNAPPMKLTPELAALRKSMDRYFNETGGFPVRWEDLIKAKYISKIPLKPNGKEWEWVEFTRAINP